MKRAVMLTALLLAVLCAVQFFSCEQTGESGNTGKQEGNGTTTDTESVGTEFPELEAEDFGGAEITFLVVEPNEVNNRLREINVIEENGDILNDSVFRRNVIIEDKYNIKFEVVEANVADSISKVVNSGDDSYDVALGGIGNSYASAGKGYLLDLNEVPYVDLSNPWWNQDSVSGGSIAGKNYLAVSDINLLSLDNMAVMMFNKKIVSDLSLESPYDLVKSGEWTIDKLYEISGKVLKDVNGDGKFTKDDMYGFASSDDNHARAWGIPCEIKIASRDEDGFMKMTYNSERTQNVLEKLVKLYSARSTYKHFNEFNSPYMLVDGPNMFKDGRALIASSFLKIASVLRGMDTDFGIIPIPKYDEIQEEYHTTVHDSTTVICFPRTINDPDMSGLIAEALCVYSHYDVIPEYYEISLKTKSSRDTESEAMIDLIRDSLMFNFGEMYSVMLDGALGLLGNTIIAGSSKFASRYA